MKESTEKRIYEIIPGAILWTVFISAFVFSFARPLWVIYFIIAYDLLWLIRITHFTILLNFSWRIHKKEVRTDWLGKMDYEKLPWEKIYHYVILPTAGEPFEVLDTTLSSIAGSSYPNEKIMIHLAGEERFKEGFRENVKQLTDKYSSVFYKIIATEHPMDVVGEMRGKGANAHYAGHEGQKIIDAMGIKHEDIMCSYFDSDTCVHEKYFANLTYKYLTTPDPIHKAYQPAVVYNNNVWDAPAITRITAFGTVFWLMAELVRPERMYTFSSHSMPYKALVDIGFWQKDIVTDDSRIFLQGFFRYNGNFKVVPMYVPVSMDNVMAESLWQSAKNLYKQQRRWAWGVEHFPYLMLKFKEHPEISFLTKAKHVFNSLEGMFSWATAPLLIFVLGRVPLFIAGFTKDSSSVIVQNTPFVLEWLMGLAMMGIVVSAIFSFGVLPKRPSDKSPHNWWVMVLQWLMLPITLVLFGAIPAIESQTRLMLGKKYHLGFWVTPKKR